MTRNGSSGSDSLLDASVSRRAFAHGAARLALGPGRRRRHRRVDGIRRTRARCGVQGNAAVQDRLRRAADGPGRAGRHRHAARLRTRRRGIQRRRRHRRPTGRGRAPGRPGGAGGGRNGAEEIHPARRRRHGRRHDHLRRGDRREPDLRRLRRAGDVPRGRLLDALLQVDLRAARRDLLFAERPAGALRRPKNSARSSC